MLVPISTTEPKPVLDYHVEMDSQFCLIHLSGKRSWVKCDMINVVSTERLNLVRDRKSGLRHAPNVGDTFLKKIKESIKKFHNL